MKSINKIFGHRLRIRVCGFCWQNEKLLLVNHFGLYNHDFWALPGGGLDYGTSAKDGMIREFREETGLEVKVDEFLFVGEFQKKPLHAIELFFSTSVIGGTIIVGYDPELSKDEQIIKNVAFMSVDEIQKLPDAHKHSIFKGLKNFNMENFPNGYVEL